MNTKGGKLFIILFSLMLSSGFFVGQKSLADGEVIISEICWMGNLDNANAEWIELENKSGADIDLTGWALEAADGSPNISLSGTIASGKYFLLERTSDDSVSSKTADFIYSGALGNAGEYLILKDGSGNIIDEIDASSDWPSGDNELKKTMERAVGDAWQTSQESGGTPAEKNSQSSDSSDQEQNDSSGSSSSSSGGSQGSSSSEEKEEESEIKNKGDVIINEIYPNPIGADNELEFIELYNRSKEAVDLSGWYLENEIGKKYEFGKFDSLFNQNINNIINPAGYLAIARSISGIVLDNDGGEIKLFSPSAKKAKQAIKYGAAEEGLSYIDTKNIKLENIATATKNFLLNSTLAGDWVWTLLPTPGANNQARPLNNPPLVKFSFPKEIKSGEPVFFDSSDTMDEEGDELKFFWDFGDGIKLSAPEVNHVFLKPGIYKVKLQASDGKKESAIEKMVSVSGVLGEEVAGSEKLNFISKKNNLSDISWVSEIDQESYLPKNYNFTPDPSNEPELVALGEIKNIPLKTRIKTEGKVIVKPGSLGSQYFYIAGSGAVKVYNYKKDFPEISVGDVVEVEGEVSGSQEDFYLKTKEKTDIEKIGENEPVLPEKISSDDIGEELLNTLVEIEGITLEKKSPRVYIDAGIKEAVVYIKSQTGIIFKNIEKDKKYKITGLLAKVSGEFVIMPRSQDDIVLLGDEGEVKGEMEAMSEWTLPARNKKSEALKYFVVIFISCLAVLGIFLWKKRMKN